MKTIAPKRVITLVLAIGLCLPLYTPSTAHAAGESCTASYEPTQDAYTNTQYTLTFSITNNSSQPVRYVRLAPPSGISMNGAIENPGNWQTSQTANYAVYQGFYGDPNSTVMPGATVTFKQNWTANHPLTEPSSFWDIKVSNSNAADGLDQGTSPFTACTGAGAAQPVADGTCQEGWSGTKPNCSPGCPANTSGDYPNCTPNCPDGQSGTYPDCTAPNESLTKNDLVDLFALTIACWLGWLTIKQFRWRFHD